MRIGIYSTVELPFPPAKQGIIVTLIEEVINKPRTEEYILRLVDYCVKEKEIQVESVEPNAENPMGEPIVITETKVFLDILDKTQRFNSFSYQELNFLAKNLNINRSDFEDETEFINKMFQIGLLVVTQQECLNNLSGSGTGIYFSKANQWNILTEDKFSNL